MAEVSVRPSVCLRFYKKDEIFTVSSATDCATRIQCFQKFERGHPDRGRKMTGVRKICDFQPISRRISETARDGAKVTMHYAY